MNDESDITAEGPALGADQGDMRERRRTERTGRRRGRAASPSLSVISWRDIPAQLTARAADDQQKVLLHARFQHAIDRAAAVAGLTSTDDYVQQWRNEQRPLSEGDTAAQLDQECASIEAAYPRERLEALVANGGLEPASGDGRSPERRAANAADASNDHPTLEDLDDSPNDSPNDNKDASS
ncbi:MAG: virulence factor [Ilumatobacter sp.]